MGEPDYRVEDCGDEQVCGAMARARLRIKVLEEKLAKETYAREQIEQRCDPAGDTRELILLRDENAQLRASAGEGDNRG